mgnify:CR=1 FL=1
MNDCLNKELCGIVGFPECPECPDNGPYIEATKAYLEDAEKQREREEGI